MVIIVNIEKEIIMSKNVKNTEVEQSQDYAVLIQNLIVEHASELTADQVKDIHKILDEQTAKTSQDVSQDPKWNFECGF